MKKTKIAFVAPRYHTNQVDIVSTLISRDHQVEFYVRKKSINESYLYVSPKVFETCIISAILNKLTKGLASNYLDFPSLWSYVRRTKNDKVDVVVLREFNRTFSLMAALVAKSRKQKIIFYTQYPYNLPSSKLKKTIKKTIVYIFGASYYSVTKKTRNYHMGSQANQYIEEKSKSCFAKGPVFIPFPLDKKLCRLNNIGNNKSTVRVLGIGKFQRRKNIELGLKAIKVLKSNYDIQFTWIGELTNEKHKCEYNRVKDIIKELGLEETVTLKVNVDTTDMPIEYTHADMFILPAEKENASISVVEALSYGLPVVSSTDNGTSYYIEDGKNGRIFLSNNLDSLVLSVSSVLDSIKTGRLNNSWQSDDIYREYGSNYFYKKFMSLI